MDKQNNNLSSLACLLLGANCLDKSFARALVLSTLFSYFREKQISFSSVGVKLE